MAAQGRYVMAQAPQVKGLPELSHKSNALSNAAHSKKAESKKSSHVRSHTATQSVCPSQASAAKSSQRHRLLSPQGMYFEAKLPNEDLNYSLSPAAKHAMRDGSLDPGQTFFGRTFNRKMRMRDTFTKIFPTYNHGERTVAQPSATHTTHFYPPQNDLGGKMQDIDRQYTHKIDFMKEYHESMLKIAGMRVNR